MLINSWLCLLAVAGVSFGQSNTTKTRDENGVPYANDPTVLKHRRDQEVLIAYEKESRNGIRNILTFKAL